jgi:hypothetical protein
MKKPDSDNKHTMKNSLLFVGLDVHAKEITVALAAGGEKTGPLLVPDLRDRGCLWRGNFIARKGAACTRAAAKSPRHSGSRCPTSGARQPLHDRAGDEMRRVRLE